MAVSFAGSTFSGSGVTTDSRREGGGVLETGFAGRAVDGVCAITGMATKQSASIRAILTFMALSLFGPGFFAALTGESINRTEGWQEMQFAVERVFMAAPCMAVVVSAENDG
jgi:hypothetical protein